MPLQPFLNCLRYIFFLVILIIPPVSRAQAPRLKFKHITNEEGLSNSTIEIIFQDHRGFMWFGTRDGLNRFDGYQMVVYKNDPNNVASISDGYITYIYEDRNKTLWIGTINGLNRFDPAKNTFTRFQHSAANRASLSSNHITCISEDKKGRLWITTLGGGINLFNPAANTFMAFRHHAVNPNSLNNDNVNFLLEDSRENCWVGTADGLQLFDRETQHFTPVPIAVNENSPQNYSIRVIKEYKPGSLLLGTSDNGLILFNSQLNTFRQYQHTITDASSLSSNLIRSILVSRYGTIWTGSVNGGLDLFDPVSGRFFNYQNKPDDPLSLSQRTVSALFEDNQGNMWIGTHRGGINLYMPNTEKFTLYRQEPNNNSLSYNDVKTFCEDRDGNIWIGTDGGGLNVFNPKKNSFIHYKYDPFNATTIGSNEVLDIMEDSEGAIWVGTWGGGISLYNKGTNNFTRFVNIPSRTESISSSYTQKIFEDSKKNLWVATYFGGLNLFNRKTRQFTRVTQGRNNQSTLQGNNIVSINEDAEGNIWIGTDDGGLNCLNSATGEFTHYFNNEEKKPDLRVIFTDSKGRLWVGQKGLYLFKPQQNKFVLYTTKAGLGDEFIKGITEDSQGNFWIATSNGITQFNPQSFAFRKYNTADGLQGLEFEANAFLKTKNGQMLFGGVNGFNIFYPQHITINTFVPPVYVTDFRLYDKKIAPAENGSPLQKDISLTGKITLVYRQSTFSFGFAALNYTASENNQYAYMLENWDKNWIDAGKEKKAAYTNVSPGHYVFRVKASNNDGVWNDTGTSIDVIITPPFWATWWFRLLVIVGIASGILLAYRFKRKLEIQKLEEQQKEEMHQSQLQFFTNISHEFRTPLSLILGPLEKLQKEDASPVYHNYYKVMYRNASRLMSLINELMDFRKSESGVLKLHVMPGNVDLFFQEIAEEFSELALQKNIEFTIHRNHKTAEIWFDRQILEKIIINLLSNSFKYTETGGNISVETLDSIDGFTPSFENELIIRSGYKGKKYIYFKVTDNGIGISKDSIDHLFERYYKVSESHLGSGIGLAFVKSLTALHKGSIYVFSERNKGTEIIIGIPCARDDYEKNERWPEKITNDKSQEPKERHNVNLESIHTHYDHQPSPEQHLLPGTDQNQSLILIVDDNEELRHFLRESLEPHYKIIEAADGQEGFIKAKETSPDCIISDIMMPVMNGVEFCRLVKDNIDTSHIPFIMLTAKEALESKIEGTQSGADCYFSKPLSMELLELTIRNMLRQRQKLKERYLNDQYAEAKDLVNSAKDKQFITTLIETIELHISDPDMDIDYICTKIGMSRTKLYNKIKSLTGQSIGEFIRTIRLKKAAQIMTHQDIPITEVMVHVGIQTQSYFTKAFKQEFGKTPTQFLKELHK